MVEIIDYVVESDLTIFYNPFIPRSATALCIVSNSATVHPV